MLFVLALLAFLLFCFRLAQECIQLLEGRFPELAILRKPLARFCQRLGVEAAWPPLSLAFADDEAGFLKHPQVFGDCGLGNGKRFSQLRDRSLTGCQPREDCAPCGIGQGRKRCVEAHRRHISITTYFHNKTVMHIEDFCQALVFAFNQSHEEAICVEFARKQMERALGREQTLNPGGGGNKNGIAQKRLDRLMERDRTCCGSFG